MKSVLNKNFSTPIAQAAGTQHAAPADFTISNSPPLANYADLADTRMMDRQLILNLLNAQQDVAFVLDDDRRVVAGNASATNLFGTSLVGNDLVQSIRHPDCLSVIKSVMEGRQQAHAMLALSTPFHATFKMQVTRLRDAKNGVDGLIAVSLKDSSDLREAEQMRTDFVANVSHELRSPLTSITGFIETLKTSARDDVKARTRFLELMETETQRMVRLIADLLSLSKVQAQQRQRPDGEVDIVALITRIVSTLNPHAISEGKSVSLDLGMLAADFPETVPGSDDELTQVFTNLVENALKYGRAKSNVVLSLEILKSSPGIRGAAIAIAVKDESDGIPREHIPRLTERFYRIDTHRSRDKGGTGLGLAIVKHIVNRHRGRLLVDSQTGVGSTFTVFLPIER